MWLAVIDHFALQGVCVAAYGSDDFPAFFSPSSGCRAPARVDSPTQAAQMLHASLHLGLNSGTLIGMTTQADQRQPLCTLPRVKGYVAGSC